VGATGARSVAGLVAWKLGVSSAIAHNIATVAHRLEEFPRCAAGLAEGRLSLDQVGVIAAGAGAGSDEHYAQLAQVATVNQLRTAIKLEPRPEPDPRPQPQRAITKTCREESTCWRITLPHDEAAMFDAALAAHREALISEWKQDRGTESAVSEVTPPIPGTVEAFLRLVETGWDAEAVRRPHGLHTTVVIHVDVAQRAAALHLGSALSDAQRRYLSCDASCEVWFERDGQVIGTGRTTRVISRRLRRALEHRQSCCAVPGCGATRGLHAHHIRHWEDGGLTELANAEAGLPHGSVRPFGYEDDKITLRESEATVIREMVDRYLAGQSLRSLTVWLNDNGVTPAISKSWQTSAVRQVLCSGRIAGLREHRGEVIGAAVWPAIITPAERDRVLARIAARSVTKTRSART
jgi:hypothetical protein